MFLLGISTDPLGTTTRSHKSETTATNDSRSKILATINTLERPMVTKTQGIPHTFKFSHTVASRGVNGEVSAREKGPHAFYHKSGRKWNEMIMVIKWQLPESCITDVFNNVKALNLKIFLLNANHCSTSWVSCPPPSCQTGTGWDTPIYCLISFLWRLSLWTSLVFS